MIVTDETNYLIQNWSDVDAELEEEKSWKDRPKRKECFATISTIDDKGSLKRYKINTGDKNMLIYPNSVQPIDTGIFAFVGYGNKRYPVVIPYIK